MDGNQITDDDYILWGTHPTSRLIDAYLAEGIRYYVSGNNIFAHKDDFQKAKDVFNRLWKETWGTS